MRLLRNATLGLKETFRHPRYVITGFVAAFVAAVFGGLVANASIVKFIIFSPLLSPAAKFWTIVRQLTETFMLFHPSLIILIIAIALLFGANMALAAFYVSRRYRLGRSMGLQGVGAIVALFGLGCASCGSLLLTSLLGTGAAAVALAYLPLKGLEFGIVGAAAMLCAAILEASKIPSAEACELK